MHFQLFIPNRRAANPQHLIDVGLADFVPGAEFLDSRGPDDAQGSAQSGVLVAWRKPGATELGYRPDQQEWKPAIPTNALAAGRYWIGFWKDSLPTPDDLRRPYCHRGTELELGDGQAWTFPHPQKLPRDVILEDDGSHRYELQRRFHDYGLEVERWQAHFAGKDTTFFYRDAIDTVLNALRLNYRLTPEVQNALRLLNTDNLERAILAITGLLSFLEPSQR